MTVVKHTKFSLSACDIIFSRSFSNDGRKPGAEQKLAWCMSMVNSAVWPVQRVHHHMIFAILVHEF